MTGRPSGERLFRALAAESPPAFDAESGRARFLESFTGRRRGSARAVWTMAAAAVVCVAVFVWSRAFSILSFTTAAGESHPGAWLAPAPGAELPVTFSEGTEVVMAPGSRGRVEELGRLGATFLLERGQIGARVTHRRDTSWRFLAGPFEVHVTGTALGVDWDPARDRLAVRVDEGSVAVRGPDIEGVQLVVAGEVCTIDLPSRTTHLAPLPPSGRVLQADPSVAVDAGNDSPDAALLAPPSTLSPAARSVPPALTPSWTKLEERGDYDAAYVAAIDAGLASALRASSADELLRLAQIARVTGHRDTEREALVTCRRRFPGSERASVAAYELGRSSLPSEASSWFDTYLGEQPSGPLAREASGRLFEARASAGDDRGARDAAARYLARYPEGPHAALARRVLVGARDSGPGSP